MDYPWCLWFWKNQGIWINLILQKQCQYAQAQWPILELQWGSVGMTPDIHYIPWMSHHGLRVWSDTLVSFMIGTLVQICTFEILRNFWKGKIYVFRPTHGSELSRYRVMVNSQGVMLRRTRSLVSYTRQLKVPLCSFIGAPIFCPLLFVCCIRILRLL